jgi:hypothetical protein
MLIVAGRIEYRKLEKPYVLFKKNAATATAVPNTFSLLSDFLLLILLDELVAFLDNRFVNL